MGSEPSGTPHAPVAEIRLDVRARCRRLTVAGTIEAWMFGETGRPVVFLQHGLGSRKERMLELALRMADAGFCAVAMDAPAHGDRRDPDSGARLADRDHPEFVPFLHEIVTKAAEELAIVATAIGARRWGVAGHSLGGRVAVEAMRMHPEVVAGAAVGSPFGADLLPAHLPAAVRQTLTAAEPENNPQWLAPRPLLLAHAVDDPVVPVSGSRALHGALTPWYASHPDHLRTLEIPAGGHDLVPELQTAVEQFFKCHFRVP